LLLFHLDSGKFRSKQFNIVVWNSL
jgi:hypothetical protein